MLRRIALALALLTPAALFAQGSPYSPTIIGPITVSATGTTAAYSMSGKSNTTGSTATSFSSCTITFYGLNLTTATFSILGSSDSGLSYFAVPISALATPGTTATTTTATTAGLYQWNCGGFNYFKIQTSGTFTASQVFFTFTESPNAQLSRSSGGGSGPVFSPCTQTGAFYYWNGTTGGCDTNVTTDGSGDVGVGTIVATATFGGPIFQIGAGSGNGFGTIGGDTIAVYSGTAGIALWRNAYLALTSSVPFCWSSGDATSLGCDGHAAMSRDPSGAGVDIGQSSTVGDKTGTLQAGVTATDPVCTAASDIGKYWFNTTTTTTLFRICVDVAGTIGWVTK